MYMKSNYTPLNNQVEILKKYIAQQAIRPTVLELTYKVICSCKQSVKISV